jgi:tetratricopeptide (TPR) repeat protein
MDMNQFFHKLDSLINTKGLKEGESYVKQSLSEAQKDGDYKAVVSIANELGGMYRVTGRLSEAMNVYELSVSILKLLKLEHTTEYGTTLINLASVHSEGKEYIEALALYQQAAQIYEKSGVSNDYNTATLYNNISQAYDGLEENHKAVKSAEKALKIIKKLPGKEIETATSYTTLAVRYIHNQRYTEAEECIKKAEDIFLNTGKKNVNPHYAATLAAKGELYYYKGNTELAEKNFEQAIMIIREKFGENIAFDTILKNIERIYDENSGAVKLDNKNIISQSEERISGMALSEEYYKVFGKKMIDEKFPEYRKYIAVGLVGEGSECLGIDDEYSQDHDFGPGFCIWLPQKIYEEIGTEMQIAYEMLPESFKGIRKMETPEGKGRTGVFSIENFYKRHIGTMPVTNRDWMFIPEISLCTVTNGKIFEDNSGKFSECREKLLCFYPQDVFLKKMAARVAVMAQSGQYNYERCMKRGEISSAYIACSEFIKTTVSAVYLLNKKYMPYYKWMFKLMDDLIILPEIKQMLGELVAIPDIEENLAEKVDLIEKICIYMRKELNRQDLSDSNDNFLHSHCQIIMNKISDPQIKNLPVMYDIK